MHIHIYAYTHIYKQTHIYIYTHTHPNTHTHIYTNICYTTGSTHTYTGSFCSNKKEQSVALRSPTLT